MAQFDVYRNPNPETAALIPYLLDVQADLLGRLATRVVAPLVLASELGKPAKCLNPCFDIEGVAVVMSTPEVAGIPVRAVGTRVQSLANRRQDIIAALDMLFTGV